MLLLILSDSLGNSTWLSCQPIFHQVALFGCFFNVMLLFYSFYGLYFFSWAQSNKIDNKLCYTHNYIFLNVKYISDLLCLCSCYIQNEISTVQRDSIFITFSILIPECFVINQLKSMLTC